MTSPCVRFRFWIALHPKLSRSRPFLVRALRWLLLVWSNSVWLPRELWSSTINLIATVVVSELVAQWPLLSTYLVSHRQKAKLVQSLILEMSRFTAPHAQGSYYSRLALVLSADGRLGWGFKLHGKFSLISLKHAGILLARITPKIFRAFWTWARHTGLLPRLM